NVFEFQNTARSETSRPIIVDLTDVPYMDSVGLGSILGVFASCQRTSRGFALLAQARAFAHCLKSPRLIVFCCYPTRSEPPRPNSRRGRNGHNVELNSG